MFEILLVILVFAAMFCSIFAWYNTKILMDDLEDIKDHLGIEKKEIKSFLDKDLDG
ncbi:hypothetical protein [Filobacillus milosensis]|uniref:hypothetical protein n=1 Tax=Filobacillus milosensis TaxID=94137 RepID=UPI00129A1BAC|nr:hypothetical protein [Filobacillus milosensis]